MLAHHLVDPQRAGVPALAGWFSTLWKTSRLKAIHQRWCPGFSRLVFHFVENESPKGYTPALVSRLQPVGFPLRGKRVA
jgi:hypothetical protein